ncbi:hypothetical protein [Allonocardiopsis opalescens]|uniref:Serine esterase DUF676 n=1 Tax=Allonocardiopsis opalescens TaxID=1144618 RepID=A0A2T0Q1T6_9ACTN|nr:hypothetical protein [Allonocardiopsis opalescens]PRX97739.1 hypothetical protein CLV72_10589 [Allonocardiopsis opalescens]
MSEQQHPPVEAFGLLFPTRPRPEPAPWPDDEWRLPGGTAWVYYGAGNRRLTRPVVLADDFGTGPSGLDRLWEVLERGGHPFAGGLRDRGRDVVLVGYDEPGARIQDNAEAVVAAVLEAIERRLGDTPLAVGGLGMGGLVTRFALAKLEYERIDHQTAVHLSYDSPHRGAWVPIGLQAMAHLLASAPEMSRQVNCPAARQLLWRHIAAVDAVPAEDPLRTELLTELRHYGGWPARPRRIGVANGNGGGIGNGVPPGATAVEVTGGRLDGTALCTQGGAEKQAVARLKGALDDITVYTSELPALDGAPGGTLESFGAAGDRLKAAGKTGVFHRSVCFVPSVSAVSIADLDQPYTDIDALPPEHAELDDYLLSSTNEEHARMSADLCGWILDRLPG